MCNNNKIITSIDLHVYLMMVIHSAGRGIGYHNVSRSAVLQSNTLSALCVKLLCANALLNHPCSAVLAERAYSGWSTVKQGSL